ncbi:sulfite exporter TauE/SafE family protein [Salinisphaera sp. T31B1]|uniref:sulfite exporter TauE/SafE family protein n=1 Tax=Salinisphaera sp. T31B1 TaxID=727963 RepID=UPI00333FF3F4
MAILFGIIVGLALGLTGGGGSIFAVPLLIYGLGVAPASAVAISLGAVAITAAFGAAEGLYRGVVELRAALIFAVAGMVAAPLGVYIGGRVSDTVVVLLFAGLMIVVAVRMGLKARRTPDESAVVRARFAEQATADPGTVCRYSGDGRLRLNAPCSAALAAVGLVVGVLSGFFGVGGGFLIVPALILITEMGIHRAVATSLLVITLIGLSGVASAMFSGREIDWALTALFVVGGVLGMAGGRRLARHLAGPRLQWLFAAAMLATAGFIIVERLLFGG